ncbi:MAG: SUMF1/EgtB/PvdO family nonheme iron enzyme [Planctomycetota bacterium]|nr:SUMF1/EgtB/PvdO family nonheme iron enzyme [Planctomycetota bacterium]
MFCRAFTLLQTAALGLVLTLVWPSDSTAQDRVALLIGNSSYGKESLPAATTNLEVLSTALEKAGFAVTVKENVKDFRRELEAFNLLCPDGGISLFYYCGYANRYQRKISRTVTQADGSKEKVETMELTSGLLPIEKPPTQGYPLADITRTFRDRSAARLHLVFLDCAWSNPAIKESAWQGLGEIDPTIFPGAMVCTAMPAGKSLPGESPSLLAASVARHINTANRPLTEIMTTIRDDVTRASGSRQTPWFDFSLAKDASARLQSTRKRTISTARQPPTNPRAGDEWINGLGMVFCWCPPGSFRMGLTDSSTPQTQDARQVNVTLSSGFWIGKYELTNASYFKMRKRTANPKSLVSHGNVPLTFLKGPSAKGFNKNIVTVEGKAGRIPAGWEYRLPTEAEWEYACRAGTSTGYSFGDNANELFRYANYADASLYATDDTFYYADRKHDDGVGLRPAAVGSFEPNGWGIHDMHGNVSEYCLDSYFPTLPGGIDPLPEDKKGGIVHRGGGWCSTADYCLAGFRNGAPNNNNFGETSHIGLRLVLAKIRTKGAKK